MGLKFDKKRGLTWERHSIDKVALWGKGIDIGDPVHAGVNVTQDSSLRLTVVWRCIRLISETLAALPADIFRKKDEIREPVERLPRWLDQPNPETSWFEFSERIFESLAMDGNAFVLITARDSLGFPSEVYVLNPHEVSVPDRRSFLWGSSQKLTRFTPVMPTGDVLHIKLATGGGLRGLSPLEHARQAVGLGLVSEKFASRFFSKGQALSGVIELPENSGMAKTQEHIEAIRRNWAAHHEGSDRSFAPGILTGGATWRPMSITPEQAQFLESRKFQVDEIARIYGVPPHMVGAIERTTSWGTGIEQQSIGFVRFTLRPWMVRFEAAMSQLLPRGQFLKLNERALIRGDSATEAQVFARAIQVGWMSRAEARALMDLPPEPGLDRFMFPLNEQILPADGIPEEPEAQPNTGGAQAGEVSV